MIVILLTCPSNRRFNATAAPVVTMTFLDDLIGANEVTGTNYTAGGESLDNRTINEAFNDTNFSEWWNSEYNIYEVDVNTVNEIRKSFEDVKIKLVMSTWCSDSRREVPRFYKILDEIGYPSENVCLINVNRDKVGLADEVDGLEINFVPTIIFYGNNEEVGRIIEMPYESLEKDMLEIVKK